MPEKLTSSTVGAPCPTIGGRELASGEVPAVGVRPVPHPAAVVSGV